MAATKEEKKDAVAAEAAVVETPAVEAPAPAEPAQEVPILTGAEKTKEDIYRSFATYLNAKVEKAFQPVARRVLEQKGMEIKMRQVFGDQVGRDLMVAVYQGLLTLVTTKDENGAAQVTSVGIPGGFGSIQLTTAAATTKRTPQGQTVEVPKRWRLKYSPGKTVDETLDSLAPPPADAPEEPTATPAAE
jgi:nucleoid DNA-binding protein